MKTIRVAAAVIVRGDRIFAAQRGYGAHKDGWEFPGGKIEEGETAEEALRREIREELGMIISVKEKICTVEQDEPGFRLSMDVFLAEIEEGTPVLLEHESAKWLKKEELDTVDWLAADQSILENVKMMIH